MIMPATPTARRHHALRFVSFLAMPILTNAGVLARTADLAPQEIIELPVYTVTGARELPPPEQWSYARIDGFEVLSNSSERETRNILQQLRRFSQALDIVWPGIQRAADTPALLIICGRAAQFDQFVPAGAESGIDRGKVSLSLHSREQAAIVLDHEAKVLDLSLNGAEVKEFEVEAPQQLLREYIRFLFARTHVAFPPWFTEGVAQILMSMEVSDRLIAVGRVEDPNLTKAGGPSSLAPDEWDRSFNGALRNRALMPMSELLNVPPDSPHVRDPIGGIWAKQCAAFVHWGLYGNYGRDQKAFLNFVVQSTRAPISEAFFKECFKLTYQQMLLELRSYADFTVYTATEFRARKGERLAPLPPLEIRDATQAEIGRIKGAALRLAGHDAAARATLLTAYLRGDRDPALLAALGLQELALGETARARKLLEAAMQAGPLPARAYVELAKMRIGEIDAAASAWTPAQVASIVTPLLAARDLPPPRADVYELLAATWARAASVPGIPELKIADEGVQRFPRNLKLIHDAAVLMERAGRPADAAMILRHGLSVAPNEQVRASLTRFLSTLPPTAAPK